MKTTRNADGEICIIVTEDELADLRSDIAAAHGEFCISSDNCDCSVRAADLALPPSSILVG